MRRKSILSLLILVSLILCISAVSASEINDTDSSVSSVNTISTDSNLETINDNDLSSSYSSVNTSSECVSTDSSNTVESANSDEGDVQTASNNLDGKSDVGSNTVQTSKSNVVSTKSQTNTVSSKSATVVKAKTLTNTYLNGTSTTKFNGKSYYVALLDSKNNKLSNQIITFKVNGKKITSKTNKNGNAGFLINLTPGTYKVTYSFAGDETYKASNGSSPLTVIKRSTYLRAYSASTTFTDVNKVQIKLRDSNGNALQNQTVRFAVNGKTYKYVTNSKGNVFLKVALKPGSYKVKVRFPGSDIYYNSTKIITVKVSKAVSNIVAANVKYYLSDTGKKFNVALKNLNGEALTNQKIYMVINKKTYMVRTNKNGIASKNIKLAVGTYSVNYYYQGSKYYLGSRPAKNAKIYILKDATRFQADNYKMNYQKGNYTVRLVNPKGKPIFNATVTFTIAGKSYKVLTNKNGSASLAINNSVGTYKIKFSYVNTTNKSQSASDSKYIVVRGTKTIITGKNISYKYGQFKQLQVTYTTAKGKVLAGTTVKFVVDGQTYTNKTDSNGVARLFINKTAGVYNVKYSVGNHTAYEGASNSSKVTIKGGVFAAKSFLWYTKILTNYTVKLLDQNGNPIQNAVVKFDIVNRTFKRVTDGKGIAYLGINLAKGDYKVKFTYAGNSTLAGASGTRTIVIQNKVIDASSIKSLARTLVIGVNGDYNKAKTLFNWVRDNVNYRYYSNSLQGAKKTLKLRSGNCCDQARLLVSLFREVGLTARYVHGRCTFLDGTYDHVWTEVKVNGKWYSADSVSRRNSFGYNAWHLVFLRARYTDLPF